MQNLKTKEIIGNNQLEASDQPVAKGVNFWNELLTAGALTVIAALTVAGIGLMLYVGIVSLPLVIGWTIGFPVGASLVFSGSKNLYQEGGNGKSLFFFSGGLIALGALFGSIIGTFLFPGLGTISGMAIGVAVGAIIAPLIIAVHCVYRYFFPKKESREEAGNFHFKKQMQVLESENSQDKELSHDMPLEENHSHSFFNAKTDTSEISLDNQPDSLNNERKNGCI